MKLSINLDTLRFHGAPTSAAPLQAVDLKRGDKIVVDLTFFDSTGVTTIPDGSTIKLGLKVKEDFVGALLALCASWTRSGNVYSGTLDLNTEEAATALGTSPSVVCALEAAWQESPGDEVSTLSLTTVFHNDYLRGNEGVPTEATPLYPLPSDIVMGTGVSFVTAPATKTDLTTLPGGVAPASGKTYLAIGPTGIWTIRNPETQWRFTDRASI